MKAPGRYVIVSPVKDEVPFVERTLASVAKQTVRPDQWVIVDDGSTDGTREILDNFAREHPWVRLTYRHPGALRQPGSRVIENFNIGFGLLRDDTFDFVVKLDCDLDLPPDYFEQLLHRFDEEPRLGIASGIYLERREGEWITVPMPAYHAAGALKMVRTTCFHEIGGFVASRGWDTVDEIKAQARGWRTTHFPELCVRHLKDEGSGVGFLQMSRMSGEIHYLTGGGILFFLAKFMHRLLFGRPVILGSLAMMVGYLRCFVTRREKLVDAREARFYRRLLNRRMVEPMIQRRLPKISQRGARYS
jgi:glycosyltransferase involved in cell wall biosynthesis